MTSKFLERFKASINQKSNIYSPSLPINKSLNPAHLHYSDAFKRKISPKLDPIIPVLPQNKQIKKIKVFRHLANSPTPISDTASSKHQSITPDINYSKPSSKHSLRHYKIKNQVNKSYAGSPLNFADLVKEDAVIQEKLFSPYSWNDYKMKKPKKYMLLGGLGPDIGHERWKKANEKKEKMINYWKIIKEKNLSIG